MSTIHAVVFDSDGMLSHGPRFSDAYSKEFGVPLSEMTPFFGGVFQECVMGKADLKEELSKGWLDRWHWSGSVDDLLQYWFSVGDELDRDVFSTVAQLRASGVLCALATNQEKYRAAYLTERFGYGVAFDAVVVSSLVGAKKPSPELFDIAVSRLHEHRPGIDKAEVMFWDDDEENVEGARAYGFDARLYTAYPQYISAMREMDLLP